MTRKNLLVTTEIPTNVITRLSRYAKVFKASDLAEQDLASLLPSIDCLLVFSWPSFLTGEKLHTMQRLKFVQSILAGVNHIPFHNLDKDTVVSSNAGAYSDEVAEHAWGLLLSAAKRIVEQHVSFREGRGVLVRHGEVARGIRILNGRILGVLGHGGIGTSVARIARAFGMRVYAFSREKRNIRGVTHFRDSKGLSKVIKNSDAIVLALPLNNATTGIIERNRLSMMKEDAVLVNVARGELVDEESMFEHLKTHLEFRYATDVWWFREDKESLSTNYPFGPLPNFIGTLHVSGPSALAGGRPFKMAADNTLRFLKGHPPRNVVARREYLTNHSSPHKRQAGANRPGGRVVA